MTLPGKGPLAQIGSWADTWGVPNAAAAVVRGGVVLERFGPGDRQFRLASVTKLLTTYALLVALEEEAIGLDEPAGPPGSTVRHLLAHTSGYGFEAAAGVLARPDARRIYSNRGIEVLTEHLEAATGIRFADYLAEAVLQPLGMAATSLPGSPAAGGLSTVDDLVRFVAELQHPTLLDDVTLAGAVAVQFPGRSGVLPGHGRYDPLDWGLGFERNFARPGHWAGRAVSAETFGHFGASGTFLWVDPAADLGCVCLTDLDFGEWARAAWPPLCDDVVNTYATSAPAGRGGGDAGESST